LPDPEDESRVFPESDVIGAEECVRHLVECRPEIASLDLSAGNQLEGDRGNYGGICGESPRVEPFSFATGNFNFLIYIDN
jgi:hypothetical protein